jgi:hypothetical protein
MIVDQIFVEVTDFPEAARLTRRLGQTRTAAVVGDDPYVVTAAFSSEEPADLADLLREVESWVEDERLYAIRYMLDERIYFLEAGEPEWDAVEVLRSEPSLSIETP